MWGGARTKSAAALGSQPGHEVESVPVHQAPSAVIAAGSPFNSAGRTQIDWECELGVVIGGGPHA